MILIKKTYKKDVIGFDTLFLMLYIITIPLDFVNISGSGSVSKLVSLFAAGSAIMKYRFKSKLNFKIFFLFIAYIFLNLFSGLYSKDFGETLSRCTSLLLNYFLILCCGSTQKNYRELKLITKSFVFSGWLTLALMIFFGGTMPGAGTRLVVRINGVSQDPNYLCGYIIFALMYYFDRAMTSKRKILYLIAVMIFVFVILLTGSRGGLIAALCACFTLYLTGSNGKNKIRNLFIIVAAVLLIVAIAKFILPAETLERYSLQFTEEDAGAGRFELWGSLISQFNDSSLSRKLVGVGSGTIRLYLPNVAHNLWLETMFELGLIGLFVLIAIYLTFMNYAIKLQNKTYLATLTGYIALSMSTSLYTYKPIFTIFLILYLIANNIKNFENNIS